MIYLKDLITAIYTFFSIPFAKDLDKATRSMKFISDGISKKRQNQLPYRIYTFSNDAIRLRLENKGKGYHFDTYFPSFVSIAVLCYLISFINLAFHLTDLLFLVGLIPLAMGGYGMYQEAKHFHDPIDLD